MKTPEDMAREYADDWQKDCDYPEPLLSTVKKATRMIFLAGYEAAKDQLANADKVMPEWISVKERLPEYDQLVLIWHPGFKRPFVGSRVDSALMSPLYWWRCELDMYESEEVVTHWMPLPELPKDVKE